MKRLLAALLLFPATLWADIVVIQASKDAALYDEPTGALANGGGDSIHAGLTGEPMRRPAEANAALGEIVVGTGGPLIPGLPKVATRAC